MDPAEREELIRVEEENFRVVREELMYIKSKHNELNSQVFSTIQEEEQGIHLLEMHADICSITENSRADPVYLEVMKDVIQDEITAKKETLKWFQESPVWKAWLESIEKHKEYEQLLEDMEQRWQMYLQQNPSKNLNAKE